MVSRRSPSRLAWVVGLLAACSGSESSAPAEPEPYVIELTDGVRGGRGQVAWIRDAIAEEAQSTRWLRVDGAGPRLPARMRYAELELEPGVPVLRVELSVAADAELSAALDAVGQPLEVQVELERRDRTIELERDLPFAVRRAVAILDAKVTVALGTREELAALLGDDDPEVIIVGLQGVRARRERALGDSVFALLGHDDERVGLEAVECLGSIGGPEHAPGLLREARLADRAHANRLYEALANLGGEHAKGFLEFAVRNEEDPELASLAQRALERLDATEPTAKAPAERPGVGRGHRQ